MSQVGVLLQIAWRNLFASRMNLIVGLIMLVGTALVVVGGSLFDSLNRAMSSSVIGSLAGHIQIYNAESKDALALFGQFGGSDVRLEPIRDFPKVRAALEALPNVKQVVPMALGQSLITSGNPVDLALAELRGKIRRQQGGDTSPALTGEIRSLQGHLREMARLLRRDLQSAAVILAEQDAEEAAMLDRVTSDAFWAEFDRAPLDGLEYLENQLAPLLAEGDVLFIRYAGTDLDAFAKAFDRMKVVEGQLPPRGARGLLIPTFFYEELFKLKVARRLDLLQQAAAEGKQIAGDPDRERLVKELPAHTRDVMLQLDPVKQRAVAADLQRALGTEEADVEKLLRLLVTVDDQNLLSRHRLFYEVVAPRVALYRIRVGETVSMQSFARSGYVQSANVKLWGTFEFSGLEKSPLAGVTAVLDLVTFMDLYGYLTPERRAEIEAIQRETGARQIRREDAEAALFGGGGSLVAEGSAAAIDEEASLGKVERAPQKTTYTEEELDKSVVLNAAILLEDAEQLPQTLAELQQVNEREGLGLKTLTWEEAAGVLGQLTLVAKLILYFAVFVIFVVAIVIINNAMMMATLQRVREIGTLRAIGSRRGFILLMILVETAVLGAAFGLAGLLLGGGVMQLLGRSGIAAPNDQLYFFFSGPRLYPVATADNYLTGLAVVLVVSALSTLYPAFLATRVSPVTAMQAAEE